jgi:hypothetical protein
VDLPDPLRSPGEPRAARRTGAALRRASRAGGRRRGRRPGAANTPAAKLSYVSTPDLTRKVRQLDNDVQAVYEMLASIAATQQRQANRVEELTTAQAEQSVVLDEANAKLDLIIRLLEER